MPLTFDQLVAGRIRQRRKVLSMSPAALGALCGLSTEEVRRYECGDFPIPVATLSRIAAALQVTLSFFAEDLVGHEGG